MSRTSLVAGTPASQRAPVRRTGSAHARPAGFSLSDVAVAPPRDPVAEATPAIHADASAADQCDRIGALAFTRGSDIYLGRPFHGLDAGLRDHVLAHERVHVAQVERGRATGQRASRDAITPVAGTMLDAATKTGRFSSLAIVNCCAGLKLRSTNPDWFRFRE